MKTKPAPRVMRPTPILTGVLGSLRSRARRTHIVAKSGARTRMRSGLMDWNHAAGDCRAPAAAERPTPDARREEGAGVDADVKDGEAGVPAGVALAVELADHGGDVGLEETGADDDQS